MRSRMLSMGLALIALVAITSCSTTGPRRNATVTGAQQQQAHAPQQNAHAERDPHVQTPSGSEPHGPAADRHGHDHAAARVPAFEVNPASLKRLPPTLSPALFAGTQKLAYQAVKEIPETIAQLPCYCYCDAGFGHKSLHSCFVDDHAAHCAVCVDEALLAYRLQKEERLKPEQIRGLIIEQYSGR